MQVLPLTLGLLRQSPIPTSAPCLHLLTSPPEKKEQKVAGPLTTGAGGFLGAGRHGLCAELAKAVSPVEGDSVSRGKGTPAGRKTGPQPTLFQPLHTLANKFLACCPLVPIHSSEGHQQKCLKPGLEPSQSAADNMSP